MRSGSTLSEGALARTYCTAASTSCTACGNSLCPRVAAAREEAVLVVVGGGFPRRFDNCDLGERRLHRRSLVDGVEPARKIGTIVPFDALRVVIARPRKSRDIGNRIILAAEI